MTDIVPSAAQVPAPRITVLAQLPMQHKLTLMVIVAAAIALVSGGWIWSQTPDYRVLYANMSDRDGGAIIAAIQQMNVPYKFVDGTGAIMVPADKVHEVRLRLAGQGLPKGGPSGFELMENARFGTSQFLEQVNYQRALEGELARSIQTVSAVQAARVHLAMSKPSVFVREQQKPSASVVLNVYPGRSLEPAQVSAIVHLVSSSVPDLPVKNVTVIDQHGTLLSSAGQNNATAPGLDPGQLKYVHELEQSYAKRIEAILSPIVGAGNVRAEVTADVDFSQVERAEEVYRPNGNGAEAAVRSQQTTETTSTNPSGVAGGVPGALSNQPPANATAPISGQPASPAGGAGSAAAATAVNSRKDATVNYEVDKTIRHVRQPLGGIKRLSVAVVVNHRKEIDKAGKVTWRPLAEGEMAKLTELVKDAAGYNKERGDTVNVVNSAFTVQTPEFAPDVPFWKKPDLYLMAKDIGKNLLIAGALVYLVFGVLKPLAARLLAARPAPAATEEDEAVQAGHAERRAVRRSYEQRLQLAQQLAQQEPKLVANVVKEWMSAE
ncbi:MAG: flagellar basal-body MS-ring/collar protein FliF [Rhodospirillaceae bacterium]